MSCVNARHWRNFKCVNARSKPLIELRSDDFDAFMRQLGHGNDEEAAKAIGMAGSTVRRIKAGEMSVGGEFIGKTLAYAKRRRRSAKFEHFFKVVTDEAAAA